MEVKDSIFTIYDIETYRNFFCVVFKYNNKYKVFEISERKDDEIELVTFLRRGIDNGWFLVGFNNVRFDAQVLQWILDGGIIGSEDKAEQIYQFAQKVIEATSNREFPPYPEYKIENPQVDLFLQNHYNNLARSTSLKWLEYSMNWEKIQDLPYHHTKQLSLNVLDHVIQYCKNDVDATEQFFNRSQKLLELRFAQHAEYPELNLMNKSDSSVGETLFLDMMSDKLDIKKSILKKKQTHHKKIKLKDVILPYVFFKTDKFNSVLEYFKKAEITSTNQAFKHTIDYDGIEYVYGTGGIHASPKNEIVQESDNEMIVDLDVASYYPNLAIRNKFYPRHLSEEFCQLYEELYDKRKAIPKSNPQNKSLKLLLNSIYGKSGDIYSFVYDKFFQMCITVNGQLLLTMLAEQMSFIDGVTVFYANTDGITLKVKKDKETKQKVYRVWKWWEKLTGLELEHAVYKQMILRDVNNYIAEMEDGSIKYKGAFEIDVDYHKNRSQRIVPIAVRRYFIDDIPPEETINNHLSSGDYGEIENQGIYDFCIGKKIKSNQKYSLEKELDRKLPKHKTKEEKRDFLESYGWLERSQNEWMNDYEDFSEKKGYGFTDSYRRCIDLVYPQYEIVEEIDDKVIRFYVSENGLYLNKNYDDGRKAVTVAGNKVKLFMDYEKKKDYELNYQFYIDEAYKIIHDVDGTNERIEKERKEKIEKERREKEFAKFKKYCLDKTPTERQLDLYGKDWLLELYGKPETKYGIK